jgi:hypothetical protein
MAGTTRLELATSAVTVSGLQVLSTTWKSTDGTASHRKYIIDNVNVYRDVYRVVSVNRTGRVVSGLSVNRAESFNGVYDGTCSPGRTFCETGSNMADSTRRQMLAGMAAMCIPAASMTHLQNDISQAATPSNAEQQPHFREPLLRILGDMPARPTSKLKVLESVTLDGGARHLIAFLSEPPDPRFHAPADVIRAYLFEPYHKHLGKFPAVLAFIRTAPNLT